MAKRRLYGSHAIADRHQEGEELHFRMGGQAIDAIVVVLTPGAVEVAFPLAYLTGRVLLRIDPHELTRDTIFAGVEGHSVVLVDDGLLHPAILVAAARAIRCGRPRRLVVAAPVGAAAVARLAGPGVVDEIVEGPKAGLDSSAALPFEGEEPLGEVQAHRLLDEVNQRDGRGWAPELLDVRLVSDDAQDGRASAAA
jgi:pyrimidine operon attenuation protein/uracil phosphoribosyltransferase